MCQTCDCNVAILKMLCRIKGDRSVNVVKNRGGGGGGGTGVITQASEKEHCFPVRRPIRISHPLQRGCIICPIHHGVQWRQQGQREPPAI